MSHGAQVSGTIKFGEYELDLANEELRKHGFVIKLQPQPFKILAYLVNRPGELVTRHEIREHVWPGDTFVDFDLAINQAIKQIRAVLDDDPENPHVIATVPRRGYRFIASVIASGAQPVTDTTAGSQPQGDAEPRTYETKNETQTRVRPPAREPATRRKGVAAATILLILLLTGTLLYQFRRSLTKVQPTIRIVVLPFQNLTGDVGQDYFADGMTEEMISQLGAMDPNRLGVIARTSAVKYKNSGKGIDQIGQELGVDYVLEGSVREAASRARITAQLIRVSDQMHLWSESFDRDLKDVVALEADVAQAIAGRINVDLGQHRPQPAQAAQTNWEAYSAYLKGRHFLLDNKTSATIGVALKYFERAASLDPNFALAYAGIADAYAEQAGADLDPQKAYQLSKEAALRALNLNPELAEGHVSLANALLYGEWKWSDAEREYRRALELKPTYEEAHHSYSHFLNLAGRHQEALHESQRLLQLDPLSSHMNSHMGLAYLYAGRFDEAVAQLKKTIALDPNYLRAYVFLGFAYETHKMFHEAVAFYTKGVSLAGDTLEGENDLARALIEAGEREKGIRILGRLQAEAKTRYVSPVDLAGIYTVLGEDDRALTLLESALAQHNGSLLFVPLHPEFDPLRSSPRFARLMQAVGTPIS